MQSARPASKRKRVVASKPTHHFCLTCRNRRVKCDGTRPRCNACHRLGLQCEGYNIWTVHVPEVKDGASATGSAISAVTTSQARNTDDPPTSEYVDDRLLEAVSRRPAYRAQLLARYLQDRFPSRNMAAPATGHVPSTSLPHLYATSDLSSPLVQAALEAISLTNVATKRHGDYHALNAARVSRGQVLSMLHRSMITSHSRKPLSSLQPVIATIMLLSLMPPLEGDSEITRRQAAIHLEGAIQFMAQHGPAVLASEGPINQVLLRLLQFQAHFISHARRREMMIQLPLWAQVPRVLPRDDTAVYTATGWLKKASTSTDQRVEWPNMQVAPRPVEPERNIARDFFDPMPSLLHAVDEFAKEEEVSLERLNELSSLVRLFHDVQITKVRPAVDDSIAIQGPVLLSTDADSFDTSIEAHQYLYDTGFVQEHYRFTNPLYAWNSGSLRIGSQLADCAMLRIIACGIDQHGLTACWTGISQEEVRRRLYMSAYETCQHIHFLSQRSLTCLKYLRHLVNGAKNVFESLGSADEAAWCYGCLAALCSQRQRLEKQTSSLCPMVDTFDPISESCRF